MANIFLKTSVSISASIYLLCLGNQSLGQISANNVQDKNTTPAQLLEDQNRKYKSLESLASALNILETRYVDEKAVTSDALIEKAIQGMLTGLDPHTIYFSKQELSEFQSDTSGKFGGVGIVISNKNLYPEILEIIPNSPAAQMGLGSGDIIVGIEGEFLSKKNSDDLLNKIRGLVGTQLTLEIIPAKIYIEEKNKAEKNDLDKLIAAKKIKTKTVVLKRETIRTSSVTHALLSPGYVYAKISVFQEDSYENLDKALIAYEDNGANRLKGLILDLRSNPGGLFEQAVKIADLFLDSGIIVSTIGRDKNNQSVEYASKRNTHPYMPMVILVNDKSASASEIVAGALQDHNRAVIIGTTTFGKGSVQQIIELPNGGGVKLTVARYYTPKGRSIQAKGIEPDIPLLINDKIDSKKTGKSDQSRKEADLDGHIDAKDLVNEASVTDDTLSLDSANWPSNLKSDAQLKIAYGYIKSIEKFKKN